MSVFDCLITRDDLSEGNPADLVVLDAETPESAVAEVVPVLFAFKHGKMTVSRARARLHFPHA